MKNSKLITYLKSLSKREIRLFDDFINSPFHNKSELIVSLWKYLKRYAPEFDHKKLEKSQVIKHLYQENTPTTVKRFSDLAGVLSKLFEQFIQIQYLDNNQQYQERLLINAFGERQLDKAFYKSIETVQKKINKKEVKDIRDFEQLLFLETERYYYPKTSKYNMEDIGMQVILDTFSDYAQLFAFKSIAEVKQTAMAINKPYDLEKIINTINTKAAATSTFSKVYQLIIELVSSSEQNWEVANELITLFKSILPKIQDRSEKQHILNFLINYAVVHYSKDVRYYDLCFQNLKLGIDTKLLIEKGILHESYFLNICIMACELGQADWLEIFIKTHIQYIEKEKQENLLNIGNINCFFAQKKYDDVLTLINQIDITTSSFEYWYRAMEIRALFELERLDNNYLELIENKLEAFRRYCYRKKEQAKSRVDSYLNFVKFITILITWETTAKAEKEQLINKIKTEATICRLWLLNKASQ